MYGRSANQCCVEFHSAVSCMNHSDSRMEACYVHIAPKARLRVVWHLLGTVPGHDEDDQEAVIDAVYLSVCLFLQIKARIILD